MAKTLSKTGISVGLPVTAAQLSQSIDALTGVDAYDISISGSLTTTGSLRVIGNISHTGNLTTSGVITGTNVQSLGTLTADGDLTTFANSALGNAITDTITINGNITGSGDIKVAGLVSASSLNITGNSTLGNSITDTTTIGGNITLASYVSSSIIIGKKNSLAQDNSGGANIDVTTNNDFFPGTLTGVTQTTSNNIVAYTLPAAEAGLHYTFIATVTSTGTGTTTFKAPSAILNGIAICDNGTEDISGTNFIFAATKFIKGTRIYCISDGNIWHITAFCLCDVADVSTT